MGDSHLEQYGGRSSSITGNKQHDDCPTRPQYSMPGILHFLQTEWARFEMDRAQWEVDRAELQVNVFLTLASVLNYRNIARQCEERVNTATAL